MGRLLRLPLPQLICLILPLKAIHYLSICICCFEQILRQLASQISVKRADTKVIVRVDLVQKQPFLIHVEFAWIKCFTARARIPHNVLPSSLIEFHVAEYDRRTKDLDEVGFAPTWTHIPVDAIVLPSLVRSQIFKEEILYSKK